VIARGRTPLVALHLFRLPSVVFGLIVAIVFFTGLGVFFVVLTVFFQNGFDYSALAAGMMFLPFALGFSASSAASGAITARLGIRIVNLGVGMMAIGLAGIILLTVHVPLEPRAFVPLFLIYGIGQGLAQPALINVIVGGAGVAGQDAGSAAGVFLTIAQSSIAFGIAAIGDIFFARLGPMPGRADYLSGLALALGCCLVLQIAAFLLISLLPKGTKPKGTKQRGSA
jgi:predicted MFS family arabinose efflux permease